MNKLTQGTIALSLAAAAAATIAATSTGLLGDVVLPEEATRTVVITPATRSVNVSEGDVVRFDVGGQTFAFKFDGAAESFDLRRVAPEGVIDHAVIAYVSPTEDSSNGGD